MVLTMTAKILSKIYSLCEDYSKVKFELVVSCN